jgi:5'(3')-deoxyribonucleotidase
LKIALDLDGVVYEWERTARYLLREERGCMGLDTESTHWDWIKGQVERDDWNWLWHDGVKLGLFRYGHVVKGAIRGIRALRRQRHKIVVVTSRPQIAVPDTIDWLALLQHRAAGVYFDGIHILTEGQAKTTVSAELLIDDRLENVEDWLKAGRKALLFDRAWNRGMPVPVGAERALGWGHLVKIMERKAS